MFLKKTFLCLVAAFVCGGRVHAQTSERLQYFDLQDVRLLSSPFKQAEELDLRYLLEMDPDRLLAPFLREAGLPSPKESYGNWENTGLDGHIGGHYLSALAHMFASTGDARIKERLDYMLSNLKRCQEANGNGYIGGVPEGKRIWTEIQQGKIDAGGFSLNGKWVPLYNIHKTYAGLRDAYLQTGSVLAKEMLIGMTDWAIALVQHLSDTQIQAMLRSEHGGLNETFADVAAITQQPRYLELARQFSQQSILTPLLHHEDRLTGLHANTQIPKVLGFKRIADVAHDSAWADAARYFWDNVVEQRSIAIGGNSVSEHFNPVDDFSKMVHSIEGPETCNTYNMLRLTKMLYQTDPQGKYLDFYERGLYNHILSAQHPKHGGFVYFTQIRPGHYRVYSQPHTSMWCCVGSGMENHAKYGEMIYAYEKNNIYVNLFIASQLNWKAKGVEIVQENNFPQEAHTVLRINPKRTTTFTLHIRKPTWLIGSPQISINGKPIQAVDGEGHVQIKRTWKKGDLVRVDLPMGIHTEQLPDSSNYFSISYGPIVLGARTGTEDLRGLLADDSRMGHVARGKQIPLRDLPILTTEPKNIPALVEPIASKPLHFTLSGLRLGKERVQMELEPFYGIHDTRYVLYWPQATEAQLQQLQEKIEQEERESLALAAITVDNVVCGEQQPESDHFIREERSSAGVFDDTRWREAKGWFTYTMKKEKNTGGTLYIKYLRENQPRVTSISVDETPIGTLKDDNAKAGIHTARFKLPSHIDANSEITVRLEGRDMSSHKILEVRILRLE